MKYYEDVLGLIGNTPLVRLNKLVPPGGATLLAKMEQLNPGGSVKDRMAYNMVRRAEEEGLLKPGATLVESTSGNTGLGLAMAAAVTPYPKGAYKGQDKFLGQKIGAELTVKNSTHLDIQLFGALGISCQDEPYTFADNQIKLTSTDPNDCLVKKLKKDNAEVTSAPFDAAKNAVTLNVAVQLPGTNGGQKIPFSLELDSEATKVKAM